MFARLVSPRSLVAASALTVSAVAFVATPLPAEAQANRNIERVATAEHGDRAVHLPLSKSKILDFDDDIRDVLVSDPKIADAVVRSSKRLYLIGNKFGTTNVVVFGTSGRPIANLEIQVELDTVALEALLKRLMPRSAVKVEAVRGTVILSGTVASTAEATQAYEIASRFVGASADVKTGSTSSSGSSSTSGTATTATSAGATSGGTDSSGSTIQVVNALTIAGKDQVMLKVTIAEVKREVIKMLGINLESGSGPIGGTWSGTAATGAEFPINGTQTGATNLTASGTWGPWSLKAQLQTLEQNSLMKTLAEPNLSALSGEQAEFLVGGEYPVQVTTGSGSSATTSVEFKPYGISLNFQPVVLADDRINLTVKTEVSELTATGASANGTLALRVRRASTTLEIPSGGSMALGGLIQDDVKQAFSGTPGLMNLPILGTLFRSRDFLQSQSELVIFIQPVIVHPVAAAKLQRPDQNFRPSGDAAAMFMGRVNRVYRANGQPPSGSWAGRVGYIFD